MVQELAGLGARAHATRRNSRRAAGGGRRWAGPGRRGWRSASLSATSPCVRADSEELIATVMPPSAAASSSARHPREQRGADAVQAGRRRSAPAGSRGLRVDHGDQPGVALPPHYLIRQLAHGGTISSSRPWGSMAHKPNRICFLERC